jgi:hypothetical protein
MSDCVNVFGKLRKKENEKKRSIKSGTK